MITITMPLWLIIVIIVCLVLVTLYLCFSDLMAKLLFKQLMKKELDEKTPDGEKIVLTRIDEEKNDMKRALLISIHPEWAEKILNGKKTIEIRSWIPKGELPLEVLIYVAKNGNDVYGQSCDLVDYRGCAIYNRFQLIAKGSKVTSDDNQPRLNGKVVAKFTLNYVSTCLNTDYGNEEILKNACLTKQELDDYVGKRKFFAWHIDNLEIFDKPKELSEFGLTKAPQKCAWVYIDEK